MFSNLGSLFLAIVLLGVCLMPRAPRENKNKTTKKKRKESRLSPATSYAHFQSFFSTNPLGPFCPTWKCSLLLELLFCARSTLISNIHTHCKLMSNPPSYTHYCDMIPWLLVEHWRLEP